jgi:putative ABC transport system permease protein
MSRVRAIKVGRDLWLARGRALTMIITIAVSIVALGTVLGAYGVLSREMAPSFLGTNPASATLVLREPIDDALPAAVRQRPGIADAQARTLLTARTEVEPGRWLPVSLFVVDDFRNLRIETIAPVEGAWPPPVGTLLIESTAMPVLNVATGSTLELQLPSGGVRSVQISGVVSDAALAPAWQEQRGYAYISRATLAELGEPPDLDQLKIVVTENRFDRASIETTARDLNTWLGGQGRTVEEIRIPPPGEHPHQRLMNTLVTVLLLFTLLLFGLSGVVIATLVSGMLSRHVRQIGAMKAVGGTTEQIAAMYGLLVLTIGGVAALLSLPITMFAATRLAVVFADQSNITLASTALPWWVFVAQSGAGLLLPLLAAAGPIARASRMTVREAVTEISLFSVASGQERTLAAWLSRVLGPTVVLAMRSALRRRGRLTVALGLLAVGGGMFITGLNVAAASDARMAQMETTRGYDIDLQLSRPLPPPDLLDRVRGVAGVAYVEPLGFHMVTPVRDGDVPIAATHKDGGHGNLPMWAIAADTHYPNRLLAGRQLEPSDTDAIVVARGTLGSLGTTLGGTVVLAIDGQLTRWQVVGVVEGFGLGATSGVFASEAGLARVLGQEGLTQGLRIQTARQEPAARRAVMQDLVSSLRSADVVIADDQQADWINLVLRNHIAIVQGALQLLGVLMGVVGVFTLASAMSTSVAERAREFGIMQTLGAVPARIVGIVVAEGAFVGALSWLGALVISSVFSMLLGAVVGAFLFDGPLGLVLAPQALIGWLLVALCATALAGVYPASTAARMTVRETLAYV